MAALCIVMGIAARPIVNYLFAVDVTVEGAFYLDKFVAFGLTVAVAAAVYYFLLRRAAFLRTIREIRFDFPNIALLLTAFFALLSVYVYMFVA